MVNWHQHQDDAIITAGLTYEALTGDVNAGNRYTETVQGFMH